MFSLQTIFGQGNQFYSLLEQAAVAAHDSTKALHAMLRESNREPALNAFKLARQREREAADRISHELVNSFITPIERATTHNISSAIMGVGTAKRLNAIRWTVVERMIWAWILTIPAAGGIAYALFYGLRWAGWV